jgi:hypothetical protein
MKGFEEGVDLAKEDGVGGAKAESPVLLLDRGKESLGGVGIALVGSGDGELIVKECVGFALADLEVSGGIFINNKFLCFRKKSFRGEVTTGAAFGHESTIGTVEVIGLEQSGVFAGEKGEADSSVGLGEGDDFGSFGGDGEGGKNQINFFGEESGDKSIEGDIFDLKRAM